MFFFVMKKKFFNFNKLEIGKATCLLFFTLLHAGRDNFWKVEALIADDYEQRDRN